MADERDPLDVARETTERWLQNSIDAHRTNKDYPSVVCTACGCDNGARAKIGRSRCISCQEGYEMQYARYNGALDNMR